MKKKISLKGKKKSIVPVIAVVLVVAVAASVLFMRSKAKGADSTEMTVQSATAEKGSVSTTVVGTGTLASSAGTDVKIPAGIEIEEVLVESGDSVEAGQKLATVNEASVASVLLEVKENIESVEDAIDDLSSDANDSTTTEYLQKKVLEGQLESLEEVETLLTEMMSSKSIVATKSGVISSVNISAGNAVSSGSTSTGSGSSNLQVSANVTTATQSSSVVQCAAEEESTGLVFLTASVDGTTSAEDGDTTVETITSVSHTASSIGSSVKYPVEVTLEKTEDMLIGMSASATIIIDEAEDSVVIPVSALQERGNTTFVYTEEDSDGNLTGEVEVEVGLSNGTQVEILSGLEEGDTVYYMKSSGTDSSESGFMGGMQGGSMPDMGDMKDMGEMPGGGEMPSGGGMSGGGGQGGPGGQSE